jgi:predicted porin
MKYRPTTAAVIAGLLAAGIAPLACAQTASVTLFGIVDAYAGRFTGAPTGVSAADKSVNKVDAGGMSTSRFGMRGSESLGGGLNAVF